MAATAVQLIMKILAVAMASNPSWYPSQHFNKPINNTYLETIDFKNLNESSVSWLGQSIGSLNGSDICTANFNIGGFLWKQEPNCLKLMIDNYVDIDGKKIMIQVIPLGENNTIVTIKSCCNGVDSNGNCSYLGGSKVSSVIDSMRELGCSRFADAVKESGFKEETGKRYTIICPMDEYMKNYTGDLKELVKKYINEGYQSIDDSSSQFYQLSDKKIFKISDYRGGNTLNCIRVIKPNVVVGNSMIHAIAGIITPVQDTDLLTAIEKDGRFTRFLSVVRKSPKYVEMLSSNNISKSNLMVNLPTDESFDGLPEVNKQLILNPDLCAMQDFGFLWQNIHNSFSCGKSKVHPSIAWNPWVVPFENRDTSQKKEISFESEKIFALNGFANVIDEWILPVKTLPLIERGKKLDYNWKTYFFKYLNETGLLNELDGQNLTFLVARGMWDNDITIKLWNKDKVTMLKSHILKGAWHDIGSKVGQSIETLAGNKINIRLHDNRVSFNCSLYSRYDETCTAKLYRLNEPLQKYQPNFSTLLKNLEGIDIFRDIVIGTKYEKMFSKSNLTQTLLIPTDYCFNETFPSSMIDNIKNNQTLRQTFIENHLINGLVCNDNLSGTSSLTGDQLSTQYAIPGYYMKNSFFDGRVRRFRFEVRNMMAGSGIAHLIQWVEH